MLLDIGRGFCRTLVDFTEADGLKVKQAMKELELAYPKDDERS